MSNITAIILASKCLANMKSKIDYLETKIIDKPILSYSIEGIVNAGISDIYLVVGEDSSKYEYFVEKYNVKLISDKNYNDLKFRENTFSKKDNLLIVNSAMICVSSKSYKEFIECYMDMGAKLYAMSSVCKYPIIAKKKYLMEEFNRLNEPIRTYNEISKKELTIVDNGISLYKASCYIRKKINYKLMDEGVIFLNENTSFIGNEVEIGNNVTIYPNTYILGNSKIDDNVIIGHNSKIVDSQIGTDTFVDQSTVLSSKIGKNTTVGPFAYVRPNSNIGNNIKVGDFVEVKNSTINDGTKIAHLTYIGDADVGSNVNFGCGTVVVNYDGRNKHRTVIGDNAFIGCNTNLVSPVIVEDGGYTAAGSTITKTVPKDALAIARAKQVNKVEWADKRK